MLTRLIRHAMVVVVCSAGCGPEGGDGEDPEDLSWLIGQYTRGCAADSFEDTFIIDCESSFFDTFEVFPDLTVKFWVVMCGIRFERELLGQVSPTEEPGFALLVPAQGSERITLGGVDRPSAEIRRTDDCMKIETRAGINTRYYIRGRFEPIPPVEGCPAEMMPTEIPRCPEDED